LLEAPTGEGWEVLADRQRQTVALASAVFLGLVILGIAARKFRSGSQSTLEEQHAAETLSVLTSG
jgi:hypothetical protein